MIHNLHREHVCSIGWFQELETFINSLNLECFMEFWENVTLHLISKYIVTSIETSSTSSYRNIHVNFSVLQ
jgi:hypothetical protein